MQRRFLAVRVVVMCGEYERKFSETRRVWRALTVTLRDRISKSQLDSERNASSPTRARRTRGPGRTNTKHYHTRITTGNLKSDSPAFKDNSISIINEYTVFHRSFTHLSFPLRFLPHQCIFYQIFYMLLIYMHRTI